MELLYKERFFEHKNNLEAVFKSLGKWENQIKPSIIMSSNAAKHGKDEILSIFHGIQVSSNMP